MQVVVERGNKSYSTAPAPALAKARRAVARAFGCWHRNMSRPFTRDGETYRACAACGARRRFDTERWETVGGFYYPARPAPPSDVVKR